MNNKFLLTTALIASSLLGTAQNNKSTFAITGDGNNDFIWMNIRQLDLSKGQVTKTLFDRNATKYTVTDVNTKVSTVKNNVTDINMFNRNSVHPTGSFVAAAAYDKRSNKLFFTPMRTGELRWLDMSSSESNPQFFTMQISNYKNTELNDDATDITRMVIGANGNGYAISNDGNHFFSFTTGKRPVITDMGNIIDAEANGGNSIHNKCSSWGGDMIADAFGKLYVISANHNVYVIDVNTRIATYKGVIQGLPAGYTTNAAAVNDDGEVVLGSANLFSGYYKMSIADLKATKIEGSDEKYNASDFANANLLLQKEANSLSNGSLVPFAATPVDAKIFPNPVTNSSFNVLLESAYDGKYTIQVSDLSGRVVSTKYINVVKGNQKAKVDLNSRLTKGIYVVKVTDANKSIIINEKIVLQ
jgi:hypothetical protein